MIVCFDIGGTAIKGAYARSPEAIEVLPRVPTPLDSFPAFCGAMAQAIRATPEKVTLVSASITGVTDPQTQRVTVANIPCIDGRRLKDDLEAALGLPVLVSNDADCLAMAEAGVGAGRGHRIVFGVILGTGVGGGLVVDGRLINSDGGFAGEWGHGPVAARFAGTPEVELPAFPCGCGLRGCLDSTVSARGMEKIHRYLCNEVKTSEEITDAWLGGDEKATRTIDVLADITAGPLAMILNLTGAGIVPVGGGLARCAPLIAEIDQRVRQRILRKSDQPLVVPGLCTIEPGLVGAAVLGFATERA
nr:ROK family protein [uncultured Gellertiella sp.]